MPQVSRPKRPGGVSEFKKFECNEERQNACARISGGPYISMVLSTKFLMVFCMKVLRVVLAKHEGWHFYVDWRCICLSKSKIWSPKCAVFARPLPMCISVFFCCQLLKNWFKMPCDQVCVSNFSYNEIFYFQNWYQQLRWFLLTVQLTKSKKIKFTNTAGFLFFLAWLGIGKKVNAVGFGQNGSLIR